MLGIFNKELVKAPKELNSPLPPMEGSAKRVTHKPKQVDPQECLKGFLSAHSNAFSLSFANNGAALAFAPPAQPNQRSVCFYQHLLKIMHV